MRRDALQIWQAGVEAVKSDRLVRECVRVRDGVLEIGRQSLDLGAIHRIAVVGAGKAGAGMAAGLVSALGDDVLRDKNLTGWINVPANCIRPLARIHLHAARPAGVNEPTQDGVHGSREIMHLAGSLTQDDLCIALISGGGSALLPLPLEGVTLDDKLAVTRHLSAAGANIEELNTVRKRLSQIKGGGLARACGAGRLIALVISDVLGDPLDLIASGPTVVSTGFKTRLGEGDSPILFRRLRKIGTVPNGFETGSSDASAARALEVLERFAARDAGISQRVFDALAQVAEQRPDPTHCQVTNQVIGNNATAVSAAVFEARRLGYTAEGISAAASEGFAEEVGRHLADSAVEMRSAPGPNCLVSGGEPTVKLVAPAKRGMGGRNQQLVLAAAQHLQSDGARGILILSGGTDGEDGPTDAAGAWVDEEIIQEARLRKLDPSDYLKRNDTYHWFEPLGALIKTGPTDTNVCDLRVVLVDRAERERRE